MGAVFSMCPHLFLYPVFCILAGNLLASGHKKEFGLSPDIPNPRLFLTNLLSTIHYFSVCKIIIRKTKCFRILERNAKISKTKRNFSRLYPTPQKFKKIDRLRRNEIHLKAVRTSS